MFKNQEFRFLVWTTTFVVFTTAYFLVALVLGIGTQLPLGWVFGLILLVSCTIGGWVIVSRSLFAGRTACLLLIAVTLAIFFRAGVEGVNLASALFFLLILMVCFRLLASIRALSVPERPTAT